MKREYRITGMDCAEEVAALRKVLGPVKGVLDLQFDILNAKLSVEYDQRQCAPEAIPAAVLTTGMRAMPWQTTVRAGGSVRDRYGRTVAAAVSAVALAAGFISHWTIHGAFFHAMIAGSHAGHVVPLVSIVL